MSGTSLTDRYVWTVTRQLPPETGPDIARELRGTIEETVEGRIAAGEEPAAAERETIVGLGDPDVLAREYGGRPNHLVVIGLCLWQWGGAGEHAVQVLDPALGLGWQAIIIGFLAVDVLVTVAAWARGGWSTPLAAVSLVSAVVSGVLLVWLLLTDRLLTDLPEELNATFGWSDDWSISLPAVAVGIAVICGWEAVTALRRLRGTDPA